ncbi:hypothetical protein CK203_099493 [Vitis vinifera]|uniref:Reverse transcriptase/retrotransposon-derived protein RNase H-like domain-containing protein n=1 Tax=Vitis vinifera TaxID=29760 RepID=A0A438DVV3_VITVI|nr:hypothetical protein CK203_099493 [Vitis vinifera]
MLSSNIEEMTSKQTFKRETRPATHSKKMKEKSGDVVANMEARLAKVELAMAKHGEVHGGSKGKKNPRPSKGVPTRGMATHEAPRVEVPKPHVFNGKSDAKVLDNFLWHMERFFEAITLTDEATKGYSFKPMPPSKDKHIKGEENKRSRSYSTAKEESNILLLARKTMTRISEKSSCLGPTASYAMIQVNATLKRLKTKSMPKMLKSKCLMYVEAFVNEESFLGHRIKDGKLMMDDNKVKAIQEWDPPTKELVLALLNHNKEFEVNTDAFDCTIEGILMQDKHLIAFESRKLNNTKSDVTNKSLFELAIGAAIMNSSHLESLVRRYEGPFLILGRVLKDVLHGGATSKTKSSRDEMCSYDRLLSQVEGATFQGVALQVALLKRLLRRSLRFVLWSRILPWKSPLQRGIMVEGVGAPLIHLLILPLFLMPSSSKG